MGKKAITLLAALLLAAGAGLAAFPAASNWLARRQAGQAMARYNAVAQARQADYAALWADAEAYNRRLARAGGLGGAGIVSEELRDVSAYLNPLGTGLMGQVEIPAIDVSLPIYQGTDEAALQAGAGFWIGTSLPTGGPGTHCVLTAHNGLARARLFTDLDRLEPGDTFTLTVLDRVMTYEVDQILVTEPEDLSPLAIREDKDYVTLYTCTPYGVNTHRLLVRGVRVQQDAGKEEAAHE